MKTNLTQATGLNILYKVDKKFFEIILFEKKLFGF